MSGAETGPAPADPGAAGADRQGRGDADTALRVLYNGSCPICTREIGHYERAASRAGTALDLVDVSREERLPAGLTQDEALRRLHVVDGQGRVLPGLMGFIAVWERLPGWRHLAPLARRRPLGPLMAWAYDRVLAPWLYRRHVRRVAAGLAQQRRSA